jgi:WD40 repeat protein
MLATFGAGVATRLWNLVTGAELWELPIDADGDAGVVFDAGGKTMIVGQADGELSWWDLNARRLQFTHSMGAVYILAMAAAPGSDDFVTISADQEARAWELQSGRLLKRMPYSGDLMGLAVSADGERFATMGDDGDDRVIEITSIWPADPVAAACAKLTRNLTRNEWRQYLQSEPYRLTCPSIRAEHQ